MDLRRCNTNLTLLGNRPPAYPYSDAARIPSTPVGISSCPPVPFFPDPFPRMRASFPRKLRGIFCEATSRCQATVSSPLPVSWANAVLHWMRSRSWKCPTCSSAARRVSCRSFRCRTWARASRTLHRSCRTPFCSARFWTPAWEGDLSLQDLFAEWGQPLPGICRDFKTNHS